MLGLGLQSRLARGRAGHPTYTAFAAAFDEAAHQARRRRFRWAVRRARRRAAECWQRFRQARLGWWLGQLGPVEFWRRRVEWLAAKGRFGDAYDRAAAALEAARSGTDLAP
jgi:hypothetical protein